MSKSITVLLLSSLFLSCSFLNWGDDEECHIATSDSLALASILVKNNIDPDEYFLNEDEINVVCVDNRIGELKLNNLDSVTIEISELNALTSLVIYSQNNLVTLKKVSPFIGKLSLLKTLVIRDAENVPIPPEIGQLIHLSSLAISGSNLDPIPPEIGQLIYLSELNIYGNLKTPIPPEIGQLIHLKHLEIRNGNLSSIPDEITKLTKLEILNLGANQLSILPENFNLLNHISRLTLDNNKFESLPEDIGLFKKLTDLNIEDNLITHLPPSLFQKDKLRISLSNNSICNPTQAERDWLAKVHSPDWKTRIMFQDCN